jgi:hypothetical protein
MEPSGPDFINLDNTNGSDDPESTTPPANSPVGGMTQPEIGRVSVETSAPNPLTKFINVYSDDESLEASQRTPVRVQEEKGPEKTSSPAPEVQTQEIPQKEKEAESGLDTNMPDTSKNREDNLKDKSELDEPKEGFPQKEINVSMANAQVSIEPTPDASIALDTLIPDKSQEEVGPSEHNEEVQEPILNKFTPPEVWETHSHGVINRFQNQWMK